MHPLLMAALEQPRYANLLDPALKRQKSRRCDMDSLRDSGVSQKTKPLNALWQKRLQVCDCTCTTRDWEEKITIANAPCLNPSSSDSCTRASVSTMKNDRPTSRHCKLLRRPRLRKIDAPNSVWARPLAKTLSRVLSRRNSAPLQATQVRLHLLTTAVPTSVETTVGHSPAAVYLKRTLRHQRKQSSPVNINQRRTSMMPSMLHSEIASPGQGRRERPLRRSMRLQALSTRWGGRMPAWLSSSAPCFTTPLESSTVRRPRADACPQRPFLPVLSRTNLSNSTWHSSGVSHAAHHFFMCSLFFFLFSMSPETYFTNTAASCQAGREKNARSCSSNTLHRYTASHGRLSVPPCPFTHAHRSVQFELSPRSRRAGPRRTFVLCTSAPSSKVPVFASLLLSLGTSHGSCRSCVTRDTSLLCATLSHSLYNVSSSLLFFYFLASPQTKGIVPICATFQPRAFFSICLFQHAHPHTRRPELPAALRRSVKNFERVPRTARPARFTKRLWFRHTREQREERVHLDSVISEHRWFIEEWNA